MSSNNGHELKIKVTGDPSELEAALNAAEANIKKFASNAQNDALDAAEGLNAIEPAGEAAKKGANAAAAGLDSIVPAAGKADKGLDSVEKKANKTGKTLMATGIQFQGFSRILQDAVFGFGSIANNMEQAGQDISNINKISKETGQTIGQVVMNSLRGPGGINLALGALTFAMSAATFGMGAWTRMFPDAKEKAKTLAEQLKELEETLDDVAGAMYNGAKSAQKELTDLNLLYNAYKNSELPLKTRKDAYKQLQDQYPEYFKNLKFEKNASTSAAEAYDKLTNSIIASANARAASDLITKNQREKLLLNEKYISLEYKKQEEAMQQARLMASQDKARAYGGAGTGAGAGQGEAILRGRSEERVLGFIKEQNETKKRSNELSEMNNRLMQYFNEEAKKGGKLFDTQTNGIKEKGKTISEILKELRTQLRGIDMDMTIATGDEGIAKVEAIQRAIDELNKLDTAAARKEIETLLKDTAKLANLNTNTLAPAAQIQSLTQKALDKMKPVGIKVPVNLEGLVVGENRLLDSLDEIAKEIENLTDLENMLDVSADALGSGFDQLGATLIEGGNVIQAAGKAFFGAFGSFISMLGRSYVKQGLLLVAAGTAKNIIAPGSGAKDISGGLALVAAGAALSVGGGMVGSVGNRRDDQGRSHDESGIPRYATGGFVAKGGLSMVGENGPELVRLPTGSTVIPNNMLSAYTTRDNSQQREILVNEISGDKIRLILKRAEDNRY